MRPGRPLRGLFLLLSLLLLAGCETLSFYHQAVTGQLRLLAARQDVAKVIADPALPETTRAQLIYAQRVLAFAERQLGLEPRGRYQTYVALDRPNVVWNVFAAHPTDLSGYQWCYPVVGCAPYRGFFREQDAQRLAQKLAQEQGLETYVGGVAAYSTLGWFDDPLLSSFIVWPPADLAALLFHELAHGRVWVPSEVRFNESFASFVATEGLQQWQQESGLEFAAWHEQAAEWRRMKAMLMMLKDKLNEAFTALEGEQAITAKQTIYADFRRCYAANRQRLGNGRFDPLVNVELNNAYLVSIATYNDLQGYFAHLFEHSDRNWGKFFAETEALAALDTQAREARLSQFAEQQPAEGTDNDYADEIHCDALARHGGDTETAGGKHDQIGWRGHG